MAERWLLWAVIDGEVKFTDKAMLLLTGAPEEKIGEFAKAGLSFEDVPAHWKQSANRRFLEAQAHGSLPNNIPAAIGYWGEQIGGVVEVGDDDDGNRSAWLVFQ